MSVDVPGLGELLRTISTLVRSGIGDSVVFLNVQLQLGQSIKSLVALRTGVQLLDWFHLLNEGLLEVT